MKRIGTTEARRGYRGLASALAVLVLFGACTKKNLIKHDSSPGTVAAGALTIKSFNAYYHSLRLCTGTSFQEPTDGPIHYYGGARQMLPQAPQPAALNDAGVQTAIKVAAQFADAFITLELNRPAAQRQALGQVDTSQPASFTDAVVADVVSHFIPLCLGRAATADDASDAQQAVKATLANRAPQSAADVRTGLLVILTAILGSGEMLSSN